MSGGRGNSSATLAAMRLPFKTSAEHHDGIDGNLAECGHVCFLSRVRATAGQASACRGMMDEWLTRETA